MALNKKIKKFEKTASMFKALGHPTRLFIVDMLSKKDACVCEITDAVGLDISTISKHLSILKAANILSSNKISNKIIYSLNCSCVIEHADCMDKMGKKFFVRKK